MIIFMKTSSKIIEFSLTENSKINITITKKRMKNIRLSISKLGKVSISMPYQTSYAYAYEFLERKRDWIISQLEKINSIIEKDSCKFINNGNVFLLGKNFPLKLEISTKNKVIFESYNTSTEINNSCQISNNHFLIQTQNDSENYVKQIFIKWCKKYFLNFFTNRLKFIYNQMFNDSNYPSIKIKTMKSMWGNCNYTKRIITFNLFLAKTHIECIDYVITHELSHLIHHNHGKEFHSLMTTLIPNWKTRKKSLKEYSLTF